MKSAPIRRSSIAVATLIVVFCSSLFAAIAQENKGNLDPYTRTDPPSGWTGSPGTDNGWTKVTTKGRTAPFDLVVPANGSLYFGFKNDERDDPIKAFGVEIEAQNRPDAGSNLKIGTVCGYPTTGMANKKAPDPTSHTEDPSNGMIMINDFFKPQPMWEYIEITNSDDEDKNVRVVVAGSDCRKTERGLGENGVPDSQMNFTEGSFGAEDGQDNPMQITEVEIYPRNVGVDLAFLPTFNAPPHSGNWTPEFSFVDPNGDPRPLGGVRWVSDGPGLVAGEIHDFSFTMLSAADSSYFLYGWDAVAGSHQKFFRDPGGVPWYEDFETHVLDLGASGWRGWKGWDDDPAFDAPVTNEQVLGGAHSIKIEDNADLVREYEPIDPGTWSYSAWQYIPSDFASGGQGQRAGTGFILLNTYNDGGPYHWSVQMQFDSNDGMLKVLHGDDNNTIDVPYVTDRWVKIEAIIDLEDDWTRIYYDDQLITEYSWTGGVLGNGGGALDISAVDLFANNSTSVYYDNLALEPLPRLEASVQDITPVTGSILSGDIPELQESDDNFVQTRSGFGESFIDLHNTTIDVGAQAQGGDNTVEITIENRIDQPAGFATVSLKNWTTQEFDLVGTYPISDIEETQTFTDIEGRDYVRAGDKRIELRIKQTVFVPFFAFTFDSFFDVIQINTR